MKLRKEISFEQFESVVNYINEEEVATDLNEGELRQEWGIYRNDVENEDIEVLPKISKDLINTLSESGILLNKDYSTITLEWFKAWFREEYNIDINVYAYMHKKCVLYKIQVINGILHQIELGFTSKYNKGLEDALIYACKLIKK